jgi:hypothetical protein
MSADPVSFIGVKALEHYEDLADIKRAIVHTNGLQPEVRAQFITCNRRRRSDFAEVASELLQSSDNGAVYGVYAGNAAY